MSKRTSTHPKLVGFLVAVGVVGLTLVGCGEAAAGFQADTPAPQSLILSDSEVSHGLSAMSVATASIPSGDAVRDWQDPSTGLKLRILDGEEYRPDDAAAAVRLLPSQLAAQGLHPFTLPEVPGAGGATGTFAVGGAQHQLSAAFFARGKVIFLISATSVVDPANRNAGPDFVTDVAVQEAAKVGQLYTSAPSAALDISQSVGSLLGGVVGFFLVFGLWGYFRDPLRKHLRNKRSAPAFEPDLPGSAIDVSREAKKFRRRAVVVFLAQFLGVALILGAALPTLDLIHRLALLGSGGLLYAAGIWYRSRHLRRGARAAFGGQRPLRALVLFGFATLLALVAGFCLLAATISGTDSPGNGHYLVAMACLLAAAGICHRSGHRFAAISAERLLLRDPRPMVLYLRSFGDDSLRLRTATFGRRSLIERFTPSRFDSFEEVLVRHLSMLGPVVAINPPGTKLAPLGAARETMAQDSWQAAVDDWIGRSVLVVIGAPPGVWSPGLVWELQQVTDRGRWPETLVIVPPLVDEQVRWRFAAFSTAGPGRWPFRSALPADPARILALTRRNDEWIAITANQRTEWTYSAAVAAATGLLRSAAPTTAAIGA